MCAHSMHDRHDIDSELKLFGTLPEGLHAVKLKVNVLAVVT